MDYKLPRFLDSARQFFIVSNESQPRPYRRYGLTSRIAPFATPLVLGFAVLLGTLRQQGQPGLSGALFIGAALIALLSVGAVYLLPWERLPRSAEALPPLSVLLIIYFMREGSGAADHLFAPLLLLPLFWLALYGTRLQLLAGLGVVVVVGLFSSRAHVGNIDSLRFQLVAMLISPVICFTTQSLVARVREQSRQLETLACTDALTGAPNRRAWDDELNRAMTIARRNASPLCVALIDLDYFKKFNDTHGHQAGDALLCEAVKTWNQLLRGEDLLARYGGEEFAIILPSCELDEAYRVLDRLRIASPQGRTCSMGLTVWDKNESPWALLRRTDAALYLAKSGGRNRIEIGTDLTPQSPSAWQLIDPGIVASEVPEKISTATYIAVGS